MSNFVRYFLAAVGVFVIGLSAALALGLYRLPVGTVASINFSELALSKKPNQYLVCPPGLCTAAAHAESPIFDLGMAELRARWLAWAAGQDGLVPLGTQPDGRQMDFVERSLIMGFPDVITVRFIPVAGGKSSVAIYSRSVYGYSDFGVNRDRIQRWLNDFGNWS